MRAEVLVFLFSGRENPSWFLSEEETRTILQQISTLPAAAGGERFGRDGLGYRGFDMRWQAKGDASYSRVSIYKGLVLFDPSRLYLDAMRHCEKRLANSAKNRVSPAIWEVIQSAVLL